MEKFPSGDPSRNVTSLCMLSFDIEDWFQVENLKGQISRDTWDHQELRVERNTHRILELLERHRTTATFFILGYIAHRCPSLIREISKAGHEVACHGYGHQLLSELTPESFEEDVIKSKRLLEDLTGQKVRGYRAPSFSITAWALPILQKNGFQYDSSLFEIPYHDRYGSLPLGEARATIVHCGGGFCEIRISTLSWASWRIPWGGGGYFRLYPYWLYRGGVRRILRENGGFTFYLHPWEVDPEQPRLKGVPLLLYYRHYQGLETTLGKLDRLLADFHFAPISTCLEDWKETISGDRLQA